MHWGVITVSQMDRLAEIEKVSNVTSRVKLFAGLTDVGLELLDSILSKRPWRLLDGIGAGLAPSSTGVNFGLGKTRHDVVD